MAHPHLLAPGRIGSLTLRNRILMCPMGDNQATDGGYVTDQQIDYFEARARGGAGLLIVGSVGVTAPDGLSTPRQSAIGDAGFEDGWRRMADRVHAHGAKLALQLVHNGKNAVEDIVAGRPLLVPSLLEKTPEADPLMGMLTPGELANMGTPAQVKGGRLAFREMTRDDITAMVEAYADAVQRARDVGIDACELHAGHGYLIDNFLSPTTNFRDDEYGGSVDRRARFLVEILEAIRARVGRDHPVWVRINGGEAFVDGETLEDACRVAELAEAAGADAVHVSLYADPARAIGYTEAHATHAPNRFVELGAAVRKRVGVPVITAGRISPDDAERILADGRADFVAMGRKLLADPDLPNKLAADAAETVRPCVYHYRCISQIFVRDHVRCAVNPMTGFESTRRLERAPVAKRVLVVGGGPAGLEAARLASLRGHAVRLVEASGRLGGRFALAARTAEPNAELLAWLEGEVARLDVDVRLGVRAEAQAVAAEAFDAVVLATGAAWPRPDWGMSDARVATVDDLDDWLAEEGDESGRDFVVVGGDHAGLALANVARRRGARVEVLEESEVFAAANGLVGRWRYVHEAKQAGLVLRGGARVVAMDVEGVRWTSREGCERV
ncbi:MAG: FAD-dependent oxidoreductase, partial [Myxococcota bacterium]